MPFRANEAATSGNEYAFEKLINHLEPEHRPRSREALDGILGQHGPVVDAYPYWHPLVWDFSSAEAPVTSGTAS